MPALNALYRQYRDRAEFYIVYIQEAHPVDLWQMDVNVRERVLVTSPKTLDERTAVAASCVRDLGLELPALVDKADDAVERAYNGWPDRLYVIDRDGRIAYKSAAGPFGFQPEALEPVLRRSIEEPPHVSANHACSTVTRCQDFGELSARTPTRSS